MKYTIVCLQKAPLSSWSEYYTRDEIIEKFMDYASNEFDEMPPKKWFTLKNIADVWEVYFEKEGQNNEYNQQ